MDRQLTIHSHRAGDGPTKSSSGIIDDLPPSNLRIFLDRLDYIDRKIDEVLSRVNGTCKSHYTVEEVAELTGRSAYTVRRWISDKLISATRIGGTGPRGRLLIVRDELERLITLGRG